MLQLGSSNLYKRHMARNVSLIVIFGLVLKTKWPPYHVKGLVSPLSLLPGVWNVEFAWESFPIANFDL